MRNQFVADLYVVTFDNLNKKFIGNKTFFCNLF